MRFRSPFYHSPFGPGSKGVITEPQRELGRKPLSELSVDGVNLLTQSGGILAFQGSPPRVGGGSTTDVTIIARFGGNRKGGEPNLGVRFTEPFFLKEKVRKLIRPDSNR